MRRPERKTDVLAMLEQGGVPSADRLSFFTADLENDAGRREAVAGCDDVLHVASPLPIRTPRDESELIVPARDGTLRVRAAREASVKRGRLRPQAAVAAVR
jgi:dihydroflavonol-4-reductase